MTIYIEQKKIKADIRCTPVFKRLTKIIKHEDKYPSTNNNYEKIKSLKKN